MAFNAILSETANTDLEIIVEYYYELNKKIAKRYHTDIIGRIKKLRDFPQIGRIVPECEDIFYDKYREIIYEHFRIIYKIVDEAVVVVRIIDGRRLLDIDMVE
ncbi:MAG: type II toxin-antitoxin system RelE/ParE family toxin [Candidatus Aminicenantes bacterium]|nr:type II toxin-antitoxin system RelE/ParE family toxin [Candidatus Aminicenantes bacterium]